MIEDYRIAAKPSVASGTSSVRRMFQQILERLPEPQAGGGADDDVTFAPDPDSLPVEPMNEDENAEPDDPTGQGEGTANLATPHVRKFRHPSQRRRVVEETV